MKILLVEDDIMLNEMITEYISSTGHVIKNAKTGLESLEILGNEKFDLLTQLSHIKPNCFLV
jgi:DNA-binding response OmpR family regulator